MQQTTAVFDIGQTTDARTHGNADALTVCISDFKAGITHCLKAGREAILNKEIEAARFFGREVFFDVETLDRTAEAGGEG